MTEAEKSHLDNIRKLWIEDGKHEHWDLDNDTHRAKVRDGKILWIQFRLSNGWQFVKIGE